LWFQYQVEIFTKVSEFFAGHFSEGEVRGAGQLSEEVGAALPQLVADRFVEKKSRWGCRSCPDGLRKYLFLLQQVMPID
jgi:hypothetical protein